MYTGILVTYSTMRQVEAYQYVIQIEDKLAALGEGLSDQDRGFFFRIKTWDSNRFKIAWCDLNK